MGQPVQGCEFFTLDVFTKQAFCGNPLAVVNEADHLCDEMMQKIAREFNLSETVFVLRPENPVHTARMRIFTPTRELPFAGHPTIGTAVLLADMGADRSKAMRTTITFEQKVGVVSVDVNRPLDEPAYGELRAATLPVAGSNLPVAGAVAAALSIEAGNIGFGLHEISLYDAGNAPLFVPVSSRSVLSEIEVSEENWKALGSAGDFGIYAYCRGNNGHSRFHARFFGPEVGVLEDPATGSAAVAMAGALNAALMPEDGFHHWTIKQGEDMGRTSHIDLKAEIKGGEVKSIHLGGHAVRIARGVIGV